MNSYKIVNYGKKASRRNFSKVRTDVDFPNLIGIQIKSFEQFVDEGLTEVFKDVSPITSFNGDLSLSFGEHHFEDPKYGIVESKIRSVNYARPLKVKAKLEIKSTGNVVEREIFMGDMPYMTPVGTFVINGAERVVISQIVRSAGVYYRKEIDAKSGEMRYNGQVIPTRGAWIEFEAGPKDVVYGKLDRSKKIALTTLLRAFGLSTNESIISTFGNNVKLEATFEKDTTTDADEAAVAVYEKLRGEIVNPEPAREYIRSHLFDDRRYDLQKVGRYKYNLKLDVFDRAKGHLLAEDIIAKEDIFDDVTGELVYAAGDVIAKKDDLIAGDVLANLKKARAALRQEIDLGHLMDENPTYCEVLNVNVIEGDESHITKILGSDQRETALHITPSDVVASFSYYLNLFEGVGSIDDIDHLGNRRIRLIGELLKNQFRIGFTKLEKNIMDKMSTVADLNTLTPDSLVNIKPLTASLKEFFGSSQLSQFMDQINPLAEITQKRRVSALGTGGIARDRAGAEVRDVHDSHYGRLCPIETPEGPSIGLILSLATYAQVNEYGFIETPYLIVKKDENGVKYVSNEEVYLSADKEKGVVIASASTKLDEQGHIVDAQVIGRVDGETAMVNASDVDYMDVSPKQVVSVAASCIPFLEHDDATRALMGANMQRQAVPIIAPESPIVGTGMEHRAAKDSGSACVALMDGEVTYVDAKKIVINDASGERTYYLNQFLRSNSSTTIWQRPIVKPGDIVSKGEIIADGQSMQNGELALGRNVRVGFMTWDGYNFEDAVIMSERMVKEDFYTSIHIDDYSIECRDTKIGKEEFTRDISGLSADATKFLDANGIVMVGTEVKEGDILVGKVTPKGQSDPTPEERLLSAIFGDKSREVRDSSLRVPHGGGGVVRAVEHFKKSRGDELGSGVNEVVRVYIVQKRKIQEGDKMAGRHGNKGVISNILPVEDMPYSADGRPLDIMLNPQGVPSRMNIGQVLELHLGLAASTITKNERDAYTEEYKAKHNGEVPTQRVLEELFPQIKCATPVFDGATQEDLDSMLTEAGCPLDGKITLYDGRSGEPFESKVNVGIMYMIKLSHMVDDKLHARSIGPYTLVTQQPMGGKAQNGGQRFGEMEVWALQAYGAAHTLQEMLTVKSDDIVGRNIVYNAITEGKSIPESNIPESFRVLTREFKSLGLHVELISQDGENEIEKSIVNPAEEIIH